METNEHKQVGDHIRIDTLNNPYLEGSKNLAVVAENNLLVTMMESIDGIPVPIPHLKLSAGDVIALAGDYYTKAGWGNELDIGLAFQRHQSLKTQALINREVADTELNAFNEAYSDLASPSVTAKAIAQIYAIERLPSLLQQLVYALTIKDYGKKLANNEAHFAPWSVRAYIAGHTSALRMADKAFNLLKMATGESQAINPQMLESLTAMLDKIEANPEKYQFNSQSSRYDILIELAHRHHALAIAQDLFAMHFYSDHFAAGHLSRLGTMRQSLPEKFGMWGSILVNNMHNEDNTIGLTVVNEFQSKQGDDGFVMNEEDTVAYGDGTYFARSNDENSNLLINGMDNSLGDITRFMLTGEPYQANEFGGLTFLPEVDYTQKQPQPLFIHGSNGEIYFRSNVTKIKMLTPGEYREVLNNPTDNNEYTQLTWWKAVWLVVKLRLGSAPKLEKSVVSQTSVTSTAEVVGEVPHTVGEWRKAPASCSLAKLGFLRPHVNPSVVEVGSLIPSPSLS